jgi:hypothetical protein
MQGNGHLGSLRCGYAQAPIISPGGGLKDCPGPNVFTIRSACAAYAGGCQHAGGQWQGAFLHRAGREAEP